MIQYLYKYRPDDIYTIKLLCEQRLHFSHPSDFNDPFDCKPPCSVYFTEDTILSYVKDQPPFVYEEAKKKIAVIKESMNNDQNTLIQEVEHILNELFVLCFSYNADSSPMWAHYCNNHTGLCLGFSRNEGGSFLKKGTIRAVKYVEKRQILDIPHKSEQILPIITEKFEQWKYEEEVRIIKTPQQMIINGEWQNVFNKSALVAMFFGLRMPIERQEFYMNLCKLCGLNNVVFHRMTMPTDGSYHLIPKQIESK